MYIYCMVTTSEMKAFWSTEVAKTFGLGSYASLWTDTCNLQSHYSQQLKGCQSLWTVDWVYKWSLVACKHTNSIKAMYVGYSVDLIKHSVHVVLSTHNNCYNTHHMPDTELWPVKLSQAQTMCHQRDTHWTQDTRARQPACDQVVTGRDSHRMEAHTDYMIARWLTV